MQGTPTQKRRILRILLRVPSEETSRTLESTTKEPNDWNLHAAIEEAEQYIFSSQTIRRTAESSSLHDSLVAAPEVKVGRRAVAGEQDLLRFGYAQPSLMGVPDYFSARKYSMTLFDRLTGNTCAGSCTSQ